MSEVKVQSVSHKNTIANNTVTFPHKIEKSNIEKWGDVDIASIEH